MLKQRELFAQHSSDCNDSKLGSAGPSAPAYPVFPARPTDDEMGHLVKAAYEKTMEAFHAEMTAAKKKISSETKTKRHSVAAMKRS